MAGLHIGPVSPELQPCLRQLQRRFLRSQGHLWQNRVYKNFAIQLALKHMVYNNLALPLALNSSLVSSSFSGSSLDLRATYNRTGFPKFSSPMSPELQPCFRQFQRRFLRSQDHL
jgi:hypothetical protein